MSPKKAAESKDYCDKFAGSRATMAWRYSNFRPIFRASCLLHTRLTYDKVFDTFAALEVRMNLKARYTLAVEQVKMALKASRYLGIKTQSTYSGRLARPSSILGRSVRQVLSEPPLTSCRSAGSRSRISRTSRAWMFATRFILAKTCMTASPSRCSSSGRRTIAAPTCCTIHRITYCSPRQYRHIQQPDQDVPREGRGAQSLRQAGRLCRLPESGQPSGTVLVSG